MNYKKAISPVVATSLLLVVAVLAIVGFGNFYTNFSSQLFLDTEIKTNNVNSLKIEFVNSNKLYLKSSDKEHITEFTILNNNLKCEIIKENNILNLTNLVGFWELNSINSNVSYDKSIFQNHFTISDDNHSNSDSDSPPKISQNSILFDGYDDYAITPNSPEISPTNQITYSFWIKANSNDYYESIIAKHRDNHIISFIDDKIRFRIRTGGVLNQVTSPQDIQINKWYHIISMYNGTELSLYINSQKVNSTSATGTINNNVGGIILGWETLRAYNSESFDGFIRDLIMFNNSISQNNINQLYSFGQRYLDSDISKIDVSFCNLTKGEIYQAYGFTKNGNKIEEEIYIN